MGLFATRGALLGDAYLAFMRSCTDNPNKVAGPLDQNCQSVWLRDSATTLAFLSPDWHCRIMAPHDRCLTYHGHDLLEHMGLVRRDSVRVSYV